jgi:hypothetical protein
MPRMTLAEIEDRVKHRLIAGCFRVEVWAHSLPGYSVRDVAALWVLALADDPDMTALELRQEVLPPASAPAHADKILRGILRRVAITDRASGTGPVFLGRHFAFLKKWRR